MNKYILRSACVALVFMGSSALANYLPGSCLSGKNETEREVGDTPLGSVPFQNIGGVIVIPVRVNDSRPLHMVLDTGMSAGVIVLFHSGLGQEIGLKYVQEVALGGAGGERARQKAQLAVGAKVAISDIVQSNQTIVVADEERQSSRWSFDGVIGKSIFDSYVVEIDYQKSILLIHDPSAYKPENPELAIPVTLKNGMPNIEAVIDTEEGKNIPVQLVVDLGNRNTLVFNVNPGKGILLPSRTLSTVIGRGVQGELTGKIGRLPGLRVGPFALRDVIASFAPEEGNTGARLAGSVFDGNLGYGVLERFRVVVDYPHQRLFLIPGREDLPPFEFNMLGLSFEQRRDKSLVVRDVIEGSPAAEKGVQTGDVIAAVNGRSLEEYEFRDLEKLFIMEGEEIELTLRREEKTVSVLMTLKRLI
jgi:hypothetical protein